MLTLKNVFGSLIVLGLLFGAGCAPATANTTNNEPANASITCDGNTMTVENGYVECDGEYAYFGFAESTTFVCKPEGDTLTCDTQTGTVFTVTGPEVPTPTPYPTYTEEELAEIEEESSSEDVVYSLTSFHDCGIYSVGVSTVESLGGGDATCGADNVTFTINLPQALEGLWCTRSLYGWSCGLGEQDFWFFLLPTW